MYVNITSAVSFPLIYFLTSRVLSTYSITRTGHFPRGENFIFDGQLFWFQLLSPLEFRTEIDDIYYSEKKRKLSVVPLGRSLLTLREQIDSKS